MNKKIVALFTATVMILSITGCGSATENATSSKDASSVSEEIEEERIDQNSASTSSIQEETEAVSESSETSTSEVLEAIGNVEIDEGLLTVTMTIPADFVGETTQEELDQTAAEQGIDSIVLNEDGSATYTMSKAKQKELLEETKTSIQSSLDDVCGSEDYPTIESVTFNNDLTSFTVNINAASEEEIGINETFFVYTLFLYSGMYNSFAGETVDNVHVDYISTSTGETIMTFDSADMNE